MIKIDETIYHNKNHVKTMPKGKQVMNKMKMDEHKTWKKQRHNEHKKLMRQRTEEKNWWTPILEVEKIDEHSR